jgi:hypothetical protein
MYQHNCVTKQSLFQLRLSDDCLHCSLSTGNLIVVNVMNSLFKILYHILVPFAKFPKSDYELRLVCPSVGTEQLSSHWIDFHEM